MPFEFCHALQFMPVPRCKKTLLTPRKETPELAADPRLDGELTKRRYCDTSFAMGRVEELKAQAQNLYAEAAKIRNGDERLVFILRAMELEAEADMLMRPDAPSAEPQRRVAQQQQQPQPDDDENKSGKS